MTDSSKVEKRRNKNFIINNSTKLKEYALTNHDRLGTGIIVVNLPLIENDVLEESHFNYQNLPSVEDKSSTLKQPIAYIPLGNFWFKMVRLKIKKKYDIDIKNDYDLLNKFLMVFIKDANLENFSIYSIKLN